MNNFSISLLLTVWVFLLTACGTSEEKQLKKIEAFEQELYSEKEALLNREKAKTLADMYVDLVSVAGDSLKAAGYLYRAADLSMNSGYPERAIELYTRIRREYPGYTKSPECLFLTGFILETQLSDYQGAERHYRQFVELYPDHELADDAQLLLEYLGIPPEELLRIIEEKNATQPEAGL